MYVNEDRYAPPKRELSRLGLYVTREYKSSGFDCLIDESCARDRPVTDRRRKDRRRRRRVIHCCFARKNSRFVSNVQHYCCIRYYTEKSGPTIRNLLLLSSRQCGYNKNTYDMYDARN